MSAVDVLRSFAESRSADNEIIRDGITYRVVRDAVAAIETARKEGYMARANEEGDEYRCGVEWGRAEEREKILNALRDVRDDERQMMSLRNAAKWAIGLIHDSLPAQPIGGENDKK